jgi:hypothetical protein
MQSAKLRASTQRWLRTDKPDDPLVPGAKKSASEVYVFSRILKKREALRSIDARMNELVSITW